MHFIRIPYINCSLQCRLQCTNTMHFVCFVAQATCKNIYFRSQLCIRKIKSKIYPCDSSYVVYRIALNQIQFEFMETFVVEFV